MPGVSQTSVRPAAQQLVYWLAIGFQQQVAYYATPRLRTKFGERVFSHAGHAAYLPPDIHAEASPGCHVQETTCSQNALLP